MPENQSERSHQGTIFDRTFRSLHGLPDVITTKEATVNTVHPILELSQTFIVQTKRHQENGDTIFIQYIDTEGSFRVALPPAVAKVILRQHDSLTGMNRKKAAKLEAARRKAQGIQPGFLKSKANKKKAKTKPAEVVTSDPVNGALDFQASRA